MPEPLTPAEDASLYVLDLLDPESRRAFEAELDVSAELRRQVAELESTLEALALASPPVNPPARVWSAIAERTMSMPVASAAGPATAWAWVRAWLLNGWAVAAVLAAAFLVHLLAETNSRRNPDRSLVVSGAASNRTESEGRRPSGTAKSSGGGAADQQAADSREPASPVATATPGGRSLKLAQDEGRLQDRVRLLSEQVTMLTRTLAQQSVLPAGAARLQVFRLVSTNAGFDATEAQVLEARRLAALGGSGAGTGTSVRQDTQGQGGSTATGARPRPEQAQEPQRGPARGPGRHWLPCRMRARVARVPVERESGRVWRIPARTFR